MKIVHLIGYFQPEFGYKEYYIARNQVKLGHQVYVITSDRIYPFPNLSELARKINISPDRKRKRGLSEVDGIKVYRLPTIFELKGAILIKGIKQLLEEIHPDIVHAYEPVQLTPICGAFYKKQGYFLISDHQQFELPRTILGKIYYYTISKFLSQYMFRKADMIICPTEDSCDFIKKRFKINYSKIEKIPLGFDSDFFYYDSQARKNIRNFLGIKDDEILFITAGRVEKDKKYEMVFKALSGVNKEAKIKFLMIGSGDSNYISYLRSLEKDLGLQGRIIYHDFIRKEDLYKFYSAADLGIWPNLPSITIIEAIGCHLPVILPKRDTVNHLVEQGNGRLFERDNEQDLAKVISGILESERVLDHLKKRSRIAAQEYFDYLIITEKITKLVSEKVSQ